MARSIIRYLFALDDIGFARAISDFCALRDFVTWSVVAGPDAFGAATAPNVPRSALI